MNEAVLCHHWPWPSLGHIILATVGPYKGPALGGAFTPAALGVSSESETTLTVAVESTQGHGSPSKLLGSWTSVGLIGSFVF